MPSILNEPSSSRIAVSKNGVASLAYERGPSIPERRSIITDAAAYWMPAFAGMTAEICFALIVAVTPANSDELRPIKITGDAIAEALGGARGDAARGRAVVADRQKGLCLLCHTGPLPEQRFQGTLAPDLRGAGSRWNEGQLRLRLVDSAKLNPATIMPSYYRTEGLTRVGSAWQNKPVLTSDEIEDVVAYLVTLKDPQ